MFKGAFWRKSKFSPISDAQLREGVQNPSPFIVNGDSLRPMFFHRELTWLITNRYQRYHYREFQSSITIDLIKHQLSITPDLIKNY